MRCPKCPSAPLQATEVRPGLEVDSCMGCAGLWLDKAEVYHFVKKPELLRDQFVEAYKAVEQTQFRCPRCERPMMKAIFPAGSLQFEACALCGGTWFDAGEVQKLTAALDGAVAAAGGEKAPAQPKAEPGRSVSPRPDLGSPQDEAERRPSEPWAPDPNMPHTSASKGVMVALMMICACAGIAVIAGIILRVFFPQLF